MAKRESNLLFIHLKSETTTVKKREMWTEYRFEHVEAGWSSNNHWVSPEKYEFTNCYNDLVTDNYYMIVTQKHDELYDVLEDGTRRYRWVWAGAVLCTAQHCRKAARYYKRTNDKHATAQYLFDLQNPHAGKWLDEPVEL